MFEASTSGLLTDLYQVTMAAGYSRAGRADQEAVFHLFYRRNPFGGGYAIACGLAQVAELLAAFRYSAEDIEYLAGLVGNDDRPLFARDFLDRLADLELSLDIDAIPEGTVVFPNEPLLRVRGPLMQCQLVESALLTLVNFQTLIATKASRVVAAAGGEPVLEFGLRRAQGLDGALSASRAAYVGGCVATSNLLAGRRFGIPVRGTHAHSWVMSYDSEVEAFAAWAESSPNNCVFLVDTYDTLRGIDRAIAAGLELRRRGHEMIGLRLDSGDMVLLSQAARQRLDAAGFPDATVVASNDLDEERIARLEAAGAEIDVWGVGTRLSTARGDSALGGVYKLAALRDARGQWSYKLKLSNDPVKVSNPGIQQVRRFRHEGGWLADVLYDEIAGLAEPHAWVDSSGRTHELPADAVGEDLLRPVMRQGKWVYDLPPAAELRERSLAQLADLSPEFKRHEAPAVYAVGLDPQLVRLKQDLVAQLTAASEKPSSARSSP